MPAFLAFLIRRVGFILLSLILVTMLLYAVVYTIPPESRAMLYFPKNPGKNFNEASREVIIRDIIKRYGLRDPFPVQYARWASGILKGDWGYSPTLGNYVLPVLVQLTPTTAELTLYSLLLFIPLGMVSGVIAGSKKGKLVDEGFRLSAFIATSMPPFILAILLMAVFYVSLHWFPLGRISDHTRQVEMVTNYKAYTGLITIDGLLNGRPDITLEAFRYLVLPVVTLSVYHWATLGRVTRSVMTEELEKDYILAARSRGISERLITWRHAFRNTLVPALNSSLVSAASLLTSIFIVEAIFNFPGISRVLFGSLGLSYVGFSVSNMAQVPDVFAALGVSIYAVIFVLLLMLTLDVLQATVDPRYRQGTGKS